MSEPSAPISPLCLPANALIPVATAKPYVACKYIVFARCFFCYNFCFSLKPNLQSWELIVTDNKTKYIIPRNKTINELRLVLLSLGLPNKDIFKVEVHSKDKINNTRYFNHLGEILKFIVDNESIIGDVSYGTL